MGKSELSIFSLWPPSGLGLIVQESPCRKREKDNSTGNDCRHQAKIGCHRSHNQKGSGNPGKKLKEHREAKFEKNSCHKHNYGIQYDQLQALLN